MCEADEAAVRAIYARCHPGWPDRPPGWFVAYPTLVLEDAGRLLGYTSWTLNVMTGMTMLLAAACCVTPAAQGRGLGRQLHRARIDLARGVGATMFSGITQADNRPMIRILEAEGYHLCQTFPSYHPDGQDGWLYVGPIGAPSGSA